jgi:MoxR-like ATPase
MSQVQLNVGELKDFIKYMVNNNQQIQLEGKVPIAINVVGEAGLGKTSAIHQVAKELNLQYIKLNLSQIEELGDLIGFPFKEFEMIREDGKVTWVQETLMEIYIKNKYRPTNQSRMSHAAPEWIQGREEGGILCLDDYSRADHRFIQACMELIDKQEYISWKLPKNWHVILSTNPDNGDYNVTSMDVAQQTRFITAELKFDVNVWARWAEAVNIDGRC